MPRAQRERFLSHERPAHARKRSLDAFVRRFAACLVPKADEARGSVN